VVLSTTPTDQQLGVPLSAPIHVNFVEALDPATVVPQNLLVTASLTGTHTGFVTWDAGRREILFEPDEPFLPGELVTVTVGKGLKDLQGIPLANGYSCSYSTWTAPISDRAFRSSPVTPSIGGIAFNLTVADLDRDGLPEAIFSNVVPDSLLIFTPTGNGDFAIMAQLPTAILPRGVAAGDVDGDGWTDLVVSASGPDEIQVIRNLGGGAFAPAVSYATGQTPYGTWLGDLDADGDLDAATANFNGHSVSVLLNDGNGAFAPFADYSAGPTADSPRWVDGADLDDDGDIDLVCCNGYSYDVSVMLNDGTGVLAVPQTLYPVGDSPQLIGLRDFDGDHKADVVTVNSVGESVSFLKGNGDGTFQPAVNADVGGSFPHGLQIVDLDGDLDLDVLIPIRAANGWRAMWNDGNGNFEMGDLHLGGNHCHTIGVADWDGDGDIDVLSGFAITKDAFFYEQVRGPAVVATSPGDNATGVPTGQPVELWFDTDLAPGSFVPEGFSLEGTQSGPHVAAIEWFAGERRVRLTPAGTFVPGEVVRVTVTGAGTVMSTDGVPSPGYAFEFMMHGMGSEQDFQTSPPIALPGNDPVDLVVADFDGDAASDLAVANFLSGDVTFLLSAGNGLPTLGPTVPAGSGPLALWAGDLTGDGIIDLAVANVVSASVTVLSRAGGSWAVHTTLPLVGAPFDVHGGDFDRDGDDDLVVAEIDPNLVRFCWNDGTGNFPASDEIPVSGSPLDLAEADFDRDGDLDVVAVLSAQNQLQVLTVGPNGQIAPGGVFGTGNTPISVFPWDTNGDGWIDLVAANYGSGGVSVLENMAAPTGTAFAPAFDLPSNDLPHGIWGADLTGDGRLDLVTANSGGSDVSIFRNAGGGAFEVPVSKTVGITPYAVVGGDWNGDQRVDLAVVNRTSGDLNLLLNGVATAAPEIGPPSLVTGIGRLSPNPFRGKLAVDLALARRGDVTVRVFDVRGRAVATLFDGPLGPGEHRVEWSGTGRAGGPVATGVYFLRMDAEGRSWTRKVLRLR